MGKLRQVVSLRASVVLHCMFCTAPRRSCAGNRWGCACQSRRRRQRPQQTSGGRPSAAPRLPRLPRA
eukprot:3694223-Prymnesium_polylepis.1